METVDKSVVEKITRHARTDGESVYLRVTVLMPDGKRVSFESESVTAWRRVVKKAGMKLTTKAAKASAASLRDRIRQAVDGEESGPVQVDKVLAAARRRRLRAQAREAEQKRKNTLRKILALMKEAKPTEQEVLDLWRESVVADVMET